MRLLKDTFREFMDDDCPRMAAALSYYTTFSLPPLLVLLILLLGLYFDPQAISGEIESQVRSLVGREGAEQITAMIRDADRPGTGGALATVLGIAAVLFGATGAFAQLQAALNQAWRVEPDPEEGGVRNFVMKRILSLGMVLVIGFLLLVSLALSAAISAFGQEVAGSLGGISNALLRAGEVVVSLGVFTLLIAAIYKILPDAKVAWRDVWMGALATAVLFVAGKFLLGFWLGRSDPGSAYGAAGSLALVLVWIYYSSMLLFLGAEFTQVRARERGAEIRPDDRAVRVVERTERADERGGPSGAYP